MKKSVYVIDKPKDCLHCELRFVIHKNGKCYQQCGLNHDGYMLESFFKTEDLKDNWISKKCPLIDCDELKNRDILDSECVDIDRMSISEQVKELRDKADVFERSGCAVDGIVKTFREAADTIESLSTKLQTANMERSAEDCGGWIADRVPTKEECGDSLSGKEFAVTVDANGIKTLVMDFVFETVRGKEVARWKWRDRISPWKVIAWHKLPEPYHNP